MPLYNIAKQQFINPTGTLGTTATTNIAWVADTIHVQLVNSSYTFSAAHTEFNTTNFPSGVRVGNSAALSGKAATNGAATASATTLTSVPAGTANAVVIFKNTGSGTGQPIFYGGSDVLTGLPINTNGGNITITWDANGIFRLT